MNNAKTIGMILFFGGILLLIGYGIIQGFNEIMESLNFISGFLIGITIIGFLTLLVAIILEQKKDTTETMKKINKEDLEP
jgi:membrane protein insertase Oxa1/YidC/SpoIIIJ